MELVGKIAIVTDAARGIGQATAVSLAEAGAKAVVLADIRESELSETAKQVSDAGAEAVVSRTDVGDLESLRALFSDTETRFGCLETSPSRFSS